MTTPLDIGCISTDKIKSNSDYFTEISGKFDRDECLKRSATLGALCNYDNNQPCQYIGRPSSLNASDAGSCYVIGHSKKPLEFNKMLFDNIESCPANGDLTKQIRISATNPTTYQEDQKKLANQKLTDLKDDIDNKKRAMSKTELYIKCLHTGGDYQSCLQDEAKHDLALQQETELKSVLQVGEKYQKVNDDKRITDNLYQQYEKRASEINLNKDDQHRALNNMNIVLNTKNRLINYYNQLYDDNNSLVNHLYLFIYLLVGAIFLWILYQNFDKVQDGINSVKNTIGLNGNALSFGNNFSNIKLRNLKEFSF